MRNVIVEGLGRGLVALVLIVGSGAPMLVQAVDFPVTGTLSVNGESGELPSGGVFAGSGYDPITGLVDEGVFTFPVTTETSESGGIVYVLRYQFLQLDGSSGVVAPDGVAALSTATFKLTVLSITANGFPVPIGQCEMQPIVVELVGMASATGMDLSDPQFTIPPVPAGQCGAFRDSFNEAFAGANNSMAVRLAGDFTPPSGLGPIFQDGFEAP